MIIATLIAVFTLGLLSIFQMALASGAPIGHLAWGGQHKILPKKLRLGSIFSILIYLVFGLCITSKSGMYQIISQGPLLDIIIWIMFAYLSIGVLMNAISRSKPERYVMTPIAFVLATCTLIIALG